MPCWTSAAALVPALLVLHSDSALAFQPIRLSSSTVASSTASSPFSVSRVRLHDTLTQQEQVQEQRQDQQAPATIPPATKASTFQNDSLFAWLAPYLELAGIAPGKTIAYGPFVLDVDDSKRVSDEEATRRRAEAALQMVNIGPEERARRANASQIMLVVTAIYAVVSSLIDQGDMHGHIIRFGIWLPLLFGYGYRLSAEQGL